MRHATRRSELKPRWQRVLIALAGPVANFILALVLMTGLYMMHNEVDAYRSKPADIDFVTQNSPAASAGLKAGDRIVHIDSRNNPTWDDVWVRYRGEPGPEGSGYGAA